MDPKLLKDNTMSEFEKNPTDLPPELKKQIVILQFRHWCHGTREVTKWAFVPGTNITIDLDKTDKEPCSKCGKDLPYFRSNEDSVKDSNQ